jgi:hypothetical protein
MEYVDVTLQDFYSLLKTRGTNEVVIQSELMRQVIELAPLMAKAYEKLQNRQIFAVPALKSNTFISPSGPSV